MANISKIEVEDIIYDVVDNATHSDLNTTEKTYVSAINELCDEIGYAISNLQNV